MESDAKLNSILNTITSAPKVLKVYLKQTNSKNNDIYIYICMYIFIYLYIYICVYIYIYIYIVDDLLMMCCNAGADVSNAISNASSN